MPKPPLDTAFLERFMSSTPALNPDVLPVRAPAREPEACTTLFRAFAEAGMWADAPQSTVLARLADLFDGVIHVLPSPAAIGAERMVRVLRDAAENLTAPEADHELIEAHAKQLRRLEGLLSLPAFAEVEASWEPVRQMLDPDGYADASLKAEAWEAEPLTAADALKRLPAAVVGLAVDEAFARRPGDAHRKAVLRAVNAAIKDGRIRPVLQGPPPVPAPVATNAPELPATHAEGMPVIDGEVMDRPAHLPEASAEPSPTLASYLATLRARGYPADRIAPLGEKVAAYLVTHGVPPARALVTGTGIAMIFDAKGNIATTVNP